MKTSLGGNREAPPPNLRHPPGTKWIEIHSNSRKLHTVSPGWSQNSATVGQNQLSAASFWSLWGLVLRAKGNPINERENSTQRQTTNNVATSVWNDRRRLLPSSIIKETRQKSINSVCYQSKRVRNWKTSNLLSSRASVENENEEKKIKTNQFGKRKRETVLCNWWLISLWW